MREIWGAQTCALSAIPTTIDTLQTDTTTQIVAIFQLDSQTAIIIIKKVT